MEQKVEKNKGVDNFKQWAIRLGCPISALPSDSAINRTTSSDVNSLSKVINMVRPRNNVKPIRNNILLNSVTSSNSSMLSLKHSIPGLQKNTKIGKMEKSIIEMTPRVEEFKAAVISKQADIRDKGLQVMKVKNIIQENRLRSVQFEEKHNELRKKVRKAKEFEAMIENSTPADSTKSQIDERNASNAIDKSITLLKHVYEAIGDRPLTKDSKIKVETELDKITTDVPSFMLLEAMKSHNNQQMKLVEKHININMEPFDTGSDEMSKFKIAITKTKTKIFRMQLQNVQLKAEQEKRVGNYVTCYEQYLNGILNQMAIFNSNDSDFDSESICGEYLKEFVTWHKYKAQSEFYEKTINYWQTIVSERDDQLKGSELVISDLNGLYSEIEKTYNEIMDDIAALSVVNKKLKYLQELSTYTINSARNINFGNKSLSAFNSSKPLFDCSSRGQISATNSTPRVYLNELSMLVAIPFSKWNSSLPVNIPMEIAGQLSDIMISSLFPFLTPNAALKEMKLKCAWYRKINDLVVDIETGVVVPEFKNFQMVSTNLISETDIMSDLMEQMKLKEERNNKKLIEIQKYLNFLLNSSLGAFIPRNILINGKNFQDYEQELLCSCSMIANCKKNGFVYD